MDQNKDNNKDEISAEKVTAIEAEAAGTQLAEMPISVSEAAVPREKRNWFNTIINVVLLCVIVLLAALIITMNVFIVCPVSQDSMLPGIQNGQYVLLSRSKKVENGDIFVFKTDEIDIRSGKKKNLIKRVIGCGGDKLLFAVFGDAPDRGSDTRQVYLYVDTGEGLTLLDEDYINAPMQMQYMKNKEFCTVFEAGSYADDAKSLDFNSFTDYISYIIEVNDGYYYAMGDNRNISQDSRNLGMIEKSKIVGRMAYKVKKGSALDKIVEFLYGGRDTVD